MLKTIRIVNFQSHESTVIELDNVTVIHGLSDSGKSAIRKAIQCVVHKAPFYIRNGATEGFVGLYFDDYRIERHVTVKNKRKESDDGKIEFSKDIYIVNGIQTYERFGIELPENIQKDLKFFLQKFDSKQVNYNIMSQFDDMFFIGRSYDSIRNKMINMLVPDSDIVAKTIQDFKGNVNELSGIIRTCNKLLEETEAKIAAIPDGIVETCSESIEKLERYEKSIDNKKTTLGEMKIIKTFLSGLNLRDVDIEKYGTYIESLKKGIATLSNARNKLMTYKMIQQNIQHTELLKDDTLEKCNPEHLKREYEEIKTMRMKLVEMKAKLGDIEECKGEITLFKESITNTETKINKLAQEITESKEEFKKSLGVVICPITNEKCEKLSK